MESIPIQLKLSKLKYFHAQMPQPRPTASQNLLYSPTESLARAKKASTCTYEVFAVSVSMYLVLVPTIGIGIV